MASAPKLLFCIFWNGELGRTFLEVSISTYAVLEWIHWWPNSCAVKLNRLVLSKSARCKEDFEQSMFLSSAHSVLKGLGKEQIRQVLRAHLAFFLYAMKESRIAENSMILFHAKSISARNVNSGRYVQIFFEKRGPLHRLFSQVNIPTYVVWSYNLLEFTVGRSLSTKEEETEVNQSHKSGTFMGRCVQLVGSKPGGCCLRESECPDCEKTRG